MKFDLFDAAMGLLGGGLIGLSAALLLLGNGRIAGISGIAASLVGGGSQGGLREDVLFLAGLLVGPLVYVLFVSAPAIGITTNAVLIIVGGLLVGYGTRLGRGCTSGHGVCGLSRFSGRSLSATLTFMAVAVVTATLIGAVR